MINKADGAQTKTTLDREERWAEWIKISPQTSHGDEIPGITHIPDEIWDNITPEQLTQGSISISQTPTQLTQIREGSTLQKEIKKHPSIREWITKPNNLQEIKHSITHLENNKETRTGGAHGGIFKIAYKLLAHFLLELMNSILQGHSIPGQWTEGDIIRIRKKDTKLERNNYRPICLTKIIYKIWSMLTTRLSQIAHLVTNIAQFGYKNGMFAIDAIIKLARAIQTGPDTMAITRIGLFKALDRVSRKLLWTTLYKAGAPIPTIHHIRQGHRKHETQMQG